MDVMYILPAALVRHLESLGCVAAKMRMQCCVLSRDPQAVGKRGSGLVGTFPAALLAR